jgi:hypothetical protein
LTTESPTPAPPNIIERDLAWVKAHIILLLLAAGIAAGSVYGVENLIYKHELAAEQRADAKLAAYVSQTQASEKQLADTQAQLITLISQLQAQNAKLSQSISARNVQVAKQVKNDSTLSAQETAVRLATQTSAQASQVRPTNDGISIDLPVARNIVGFLDLLPVVQANLVDTQTELTNETTLFNKSQETNAAQTKVISDLTTQNVEQVKACAAEVKTVKAEAKRGKFKWFGIGFVAGFVTGVTAHLYIH